MKISCFFNMCSGINLWRAKYDKFNLFTFPNSYRKTTTGSSKKVYEFFFIFGENKKRNQYHISAITVQTTYRIVKKAYRYISNTYRFSRTFIRYLFKFDNS